MAFAQSCTSQLADHSKIAPNITSNLGMPVTVKV
jgi:hypothetical protein